MNTLLGNLRMLRIRRAKVYAAFLWLRIPLPWGQSPTEPLLPANAHRNRQRSSLFCYLKGGCWITNMLHTQPKAHFTLQQCIHYCYEVSPHASIVTALSASGETYECHSGSAESYIVNEMFPSCPSFYFTHELISAAAKTTASYAIHFDDYEPFSLFLPDVL